MIRQGSTARHGFARGVVRVVALLAVCLCAARPAPADDLRPKLVLPSQSTAPGPAEQQSPAPAVPPATRVAGPSDAFYIDFEAKARGTMDRPTRDALRKRFVQSFTEAQTRNATAEMQHYGRLLNILTTIAAERGEKQP